MAAHEEEKNKKDFPNFRPGDTIRVSLRVVEGDSERIQAFEGVCIRRRGIGNSETFTVRKISFGVGVERIIPICSPRIHKIELVKAGKARRAKLYYLRDLKGKAARIREAEAHKIEVPETGISAGEAVVEPDRSPKAVGDDAPKVEAAAA